MTHTSQTSRTSRTSHIPSARRTPIEAAVVRIGRLFFALSLIAFGLLHIVYGNFVTRVVLAWPAWIPGRPFWAYLVGAALIAAGVSILMTARGRSVALILGGLVLVSFLLISLPIAVTDVLWGGLWTSAGKALVIAGGAFAIAGSLRPDSLGDSSLKADSVLAPLERLIPIGRFCLGAFLILAGIQHFIWWQFVATLVPVWIPPGRLFWTYVAGVALIAGGIGLMRRSTAALAAGLSGLMIFSWVFLVHIPRALADLHNSNEATAVFEAVAFSGIAFVLAFERKPLE